MRVGKLKESGGRMTEQEAINLIHCCMHINNDGILEARDMAIKSLEKQIPKKTNILYEDNIFRREHFCPCCGKSVIWYYCPHCGQKLDWK